METRITGWTSVAPSATQTLCYGNPSSAAHRPLVRYSKLVLKSVNVVLQKPLSALQDCLENTGWHMFRGKCNSRWLHRIINCVLAGHWWHLLLSELQSTHMFREFTATFRTAATHSLVFGRASLTTGHHLLWQRRVPFRCAEQLPCSLWGCLRPKQCGDEEDYLSIQRPGALSRHSWCEE